MYDTLRILESCVRGVLPTIIFAMMVVRLIVLRLGGVVVTIFVATILDGSLVVQLGVRTGSTHSRPASPSDERERGAGPRE